MTQPSPLTPIIGMEIHVELATQSKMFCGCPATHFGVTPNTNTCPVCLGLPGALPVPNKQAIEWTIMLGLALHSQIAANSKFDRKHYFYPDLPKGYQISQYDEPLCIGGSMLTSFGEVALTRIHLEEDTAKLQHTILDGKKVSLVDFNRSSVPLVEIVTEPTITTSKQAKEYAQKIQQLVRYLNISDADMEKGSMRVEANISWGLNLGYKVEVKNINSFRFLEKAIEFELTRQKQLLDQGITPTQETRGWNENKNETVSQRSKEDAKDYRYFPEPDIPPMVFTPAEIAALKEKTPASPQEMSDYFQKIFNRADYAQALSQEPKYARLAKTASEIALESAVPATIIGSMLVNKKQEMINKTPQEIADLIVTSQKTTTSSAADIETWVNQAIENNPDLVEKYKSGKTAVMGALVGEIMRQSQGQANAKTISELLVEKLK